MNIPSLKNHYNLHRYLEQNPQWGWHALVETYGKEFAFGQSLVLAEPDKVHELLHSRVHTRERSKAYKQAARMIPGARGILFQDGELWQNRIQQVMPVFTRQHLDQYLYLLREITLEEVSKLAAKRVSTDLYLDITNMGLRLVLELGYGLNSTHPEVTNYATALREYKLSTMYGSYRLDRFGFGIYQLFALPAFFIGLNRLKRQMKNQSRILRRVLDNPETRNQLEVNWIDLLGAAGLSHSERCDELNHIYGAFNAIDYTLTCALYELARRPHIREILTEELRSKPPELLGDWKTHAVNFPETQAFMREVFRFYPVAIAVMRRSGEEMEAAGRIWKTGTEIYLLLQSLHFNPQFWDNPKEFNPDRFKQPLKNPKAYIPFLTGSRKCIGQHLAELHFLHSLSAFAQNGFPGIEGNFQIQPYLIPRLVHPLTAVYA